MSSLAPRDLDLVPNAVNPKICSDPDSFPLDAPWLDVLHEKGQSRRASPGWIRARFSRDLAEGMAPMRLAALCWCMGLLGHGSAHGRLASLISLSPEASGLVFDEASSKAIFAQLALDFGAAAMDWEPPQDMASRGWTAKASDRTIQMATRACYGAVAIHCAQIGKLGLPSVLRKAIFAPPAEDFFDAGPLLIKPSLPFPALSFALAAGKAAGVADTWLDGAEAELLACCAGSCSPQRFMSLAEAWTPDPSARMRLAGAGLAKALSLHASSSKGISCVAGLLRSFCARADLLPEFFEELLAPFAGSLEAFALAAKPWSHASTSLSQVAEAFERLQLSPPDLILGKGAVKNIWSSHMAEPPIALKNQPAFFQRHLRLARLCPDHERAAVSLALVAPKIIAQAESSLVAAVSPASANSSKPTRL